MPNEYDDYVGMKFDPDRLEVTPELTIRYARAVNDENPVYLEKDRSGAFLAPPMFGIVAAMRLIRREMTDSGLPFIRPETALHAQQDMHFISLIRSGDILVTHGKITGINPHPKGSLIELELNTTTQEGEERLRQWFVMFVKGQDWQQGQEERMDRRHLEPAEAEVKMKVETDQTYRYAQASFTQGIAPHEDEAAAKTLGYPTVFLQGQCTMAFAAKAVVDTLANGNPGHLRRLKVRFARVVYPEDILTTRIWKTDAKNKYNFETFNQGGVAVLTDGIAELGD